MFLTCLLCFLPQTQGMCPVTANAEFARRMLVRSSVMNVGEPYSY